MCGALAGVFVFKQKTAYELRISDWSSDVCASSLWTCGAAAQLITFTSNASVPAGGSMAPITLTVAVAGNLGSSVANQASVGNSTIAAGFQKLGNTDTAIVRHPDLSTSTKSVVDQNGGDANPGDTQIGRAHV